MDKNISYSIAEINDKDLLLFFKHLDDRNFSKEVRIGKYSKNILSIIKNGHYKINFQKNNYKKKIIFKKNQNEFILKGNEENTFFCRIFKNTKNLKKNQNLKKLKTKTLSEMINLNKLKKAKLNLKNEKEKKKALKMEKEDLKIFLFEIFSEKSKMYFDEIQNYVDQPRGYLNNILEQICNKKKIGKKFVFELKEFFLLQTESDLKKKKFGNKFK